MKINLKAKLEGVGTSLNSFVHSPKVAHAVKTVASGAAHAVVMIGTAVAINVASQAVSSAIQKFGERAEEQPALIEENVVDVPSQE